MKKIFRAIDNAYSALDDCISKIVKSRLDKDRESEERALYKLEIDTNGVLQDLSYIKQQLQKRDWIKVVDRLPEYEETVMVACHYKDDPEIVYIFCHRTDRNEVITDKNGFATIPDFNITHWMPIVPPTED